MIKTHGHTSGYKRTRAYTAWKNMRQRCSNKNRPDYHHYGGRGISVCERWNEFESFYSDMGDPPTNKSLDRVDNSRGYAPNNCRWATQSEQMRNTVRCHILEYKGERMSMAAWADKVGLSRQAIKGRIRSGWSVVRTLETPLLRVRKCL